MSENDTAEGSISRRTVLKGVGGAIATAGVSQVATANVLDDADMVEIPKAAKGDEIIRYKEVPKKFWNHLKTARRQSNKLKENIPGAVGVAKRATNDTISGRRRRKLVVQFSNEETRAAARVPETVGGLPVETELEPDFQPNSCENIILDPYYHGGAVHIRLDDHEYLGTCYSTGHGYSVATAGCYAELGGGNNKFILTVNHLYDPADTCGTVPNRPAGVGVERDGQKELYPTGNSSTYYQDPELDYMFVDNTAKYCYDDNAPIPLPMSSSGQIYTDTGTIDIRGYTLNLDEEVGSDTTFYRSSHRSGFLQGSLTGSGLNVVGDCVDNSNAFEFDIESTQGDSGAVYYQEIYDIEDNEYKAEIAALHIGHDPKSEEVGSVACNYPELNVPETDQYVRSFGTSAEDIQDDMTNTVYFGGQ